MNVKLETSEEYALVSLEGRVDTTNANEFENAMLKVISDGHTKIILDCSGLDYISSSGLRVFLIVQKKLTAAKGQFRLFGLQPGIVEIFDISGFTSIFSIFPNKEAATKP
jgi:anti-anti-sigma factor